MFTPLLCLFLHQLTTMCLLATNTYTHCHHTVFNVGGSFRCDIWLNGSPCFQIPQNHNVSALCQSCRSSNRPCYQDPLPGPALKGPDATEFGTRPPSKLDCEAKWDSYQQRGGGKRTLEDIPWPIRSLKRRISTCVVRRKSEIFCLKADWWRC